MPNPAATSATRWLRRDGPLLVRTKWFLQLQLRPSSSAAAGSAPPLPPTPPISSVPKQPSFSPSQAESERGSRWSKLWLYVPGAITFGLGTWQIFRRQDKIKMLEHRKMRLEMEPIIGNAASFPGENLDSLEFRRVKYNGVFDEKKSVYVGPRSRSISGVTENGYYVITPLVPIPGDPGSPQLQILVNRGWVPRAWRDKSSEISQEDVNHSSVTSSSGQGSSSSWWKFWSNEPKVTEDHKPAVNAVEIVGVVRGSENPSIFVPENDPSSSQWFYVDINAIARACGLPENTIYIEATDENVKPSNPYPLPKDVNSLIRSSVMPQDHLNYTLTWYSLSAAVTFMAHKRLRPKKSRS